MKKKVFSNDVKDQRKQSNYVLTVSGDGFCVVGKKRKTLAIKFDEFMYPIFLEDDAIWEELYHQTKVFYDEENPIVFMYTMREERKMMDIILKNKLDFEY